VHQGPAIGGRGGGALHPAIIRAPLARRSGAQILGDPFGRARSPSILPGASASILPGPQRGAAHRAAGQFRYSSAMSATAPRIVIVMPAYNAAQTLERTYADIPHDLVERIILVDDVSRDQTVEIAKHLGLDVIVHRQNRGYGGNQKTCYDAALEMGADVVIMLHPDYQYDATRIPALVEPILRGDADLMLGSRFLGDPRAGGMPTWKFVSNRFLTALENFAFGLRLSEYHTGFRAYSRHLLETIPYHRNSDDFVFDQELIAQVVAAGGFRIGEIAVPTRYFQEASSVGFRRSVVYGLSTLRVVARFALHRIRVRRSPKLTPRTPGR
jgi:glycosyltransferase involved in cell wall biosynthesis